MHAVGAYMSVTPGRPSVHKNMDVRVQPRVHACGCQRVGCEGACGGCDCVCLIEAGYLRWG